MTDLVGSVLRAKINKIELYGIYLTQNGLQFIVLVPDIGARARDLSANFSIGELVEIRVLTYVAEKNEYRSELVQK
jgi:hypothetical protein